MLDQQGLQVPRESQEGDATEHLTGGLQGSRFIQGEKVLDRILPAHNLRGGGSGGW